MLKCRTSRLLKRKPCVKILCHHPPCPFDVVSCQTPPVTTPSSDLSSPKPPPKTKKDPATEVYSTKHSSFCPPSFFSTK